MKRAERSHARLLIALVTLTAAQPVHGQVIDLPLPEPIAQSAEERALRKVTDRFSNPDSVQFRNVRRFMSDVNKEAEFCGQVNASDNVGGSIGFQLFMYAKDASGETVRILGSETLNGFRLGRKMIAALRRVGCL